MEDFNTYLHTTYNETLKIGIGIHYGPVIVGDLGHPKKKSFTAIGDTVNVAARVESATKGIANILVSENVYKNLDVDGWNSTEIQLKAKSMALRLYASPK